MVFQRSTIGKNLRELRESADISQAAVAKDCTESGLSLNQALLSDIERGRVFPSKRLAAEIRLAIARIDRKRRQKVDQVFHETFSEVQR